MNVGLSNIEEEVSSETEERRHEEGGQGQVAPVFALFSGGHDSLCSTAVAAADPAFAGVLHINTGIGVAETRQFVRETCARQGWPLTELRTAYEYERLVLERGGFPYGEMSHNSFLFYLKQKPLAAWMREQEGPVRLVTGIRAQESNRRKAAKFAVPQRREGRKTWLSPILDWSKADCNRYIEEQGLERNIVVDTLHRSAECLCGALADQREIADIDLWYPAVGERIHALERRCAAAGLPACIWAGKDARRVSKDQTMLFDKASLPPLCTSCEANA